MLTEKDYCDYDTCVALRELGYDGYCAAYYHLFDDDEDARNSFEYAYGFDFQNSNNIYRVGAPLLYQALKWLREEYGLIVMVVFSASTQTWSFWEQRKEDGYVYRQGDLYPSYEEALLEGVRGAVKLLKEE